MRRTATRLALFGQVWCWGACSPVDTRPVERGAAERGAGEEKRDAASPDAAPSRQELPPRPTDAGSEPADPGTVNLLDPAEYWADGGFSTGSCVANTPSELDASATDAGADAASSFGPETTAVDADCDGVLDTCRLVGDCSRSELVLHLPFEGDPRDVSVHGNHPEEPGGVQHLPGVVGEAIALSEGSLRVPRSPSLDFDGGAWTIEAFIQPLRLPAAGGRAGIVDDDGRYGLFVLPTGELTCASPGIGSVVGGAVTPAVWSHVACVFDGTRLRQWQDGRLVAELGASGLPLAPGSAPISIGQNSPSGDQYDGLLDGLRIWTIARTPTEISRAAQTRR